MFDKLKTAFGFIAAILALTILIATIAHEIIPQLMGIAEAHDISCYLPYSDYLFCRQWHQPDVMEAYMGVTINPVKYARDAAVALWQGDHWYNCTDGPILNGSAEIHRYCYMGVGGTNHPSIDVGFKHELVPSTSILAVLLGSFLLSSAIVTYFWSRSNKPAAALVRYSPGANPRNVAAIITTPRAQQAGGEDCTWTRWYQERCMGGMYPKRDP